MRASESMTKTLKAAAFAALSLAGACSSLRYEPVANWARDGGQLCAQDRDSAYSDWDRAAPRPCAQAFNEAPTEG